MGRLLSTVALCVLFCMPLITSANTVLPFPIPEGLQKLTGEEIRQTFSDSYFRSTRGAEMVEYYEPLIEGVDVARIIGKIRAGNGHVYQYRQPSDWRVVDDLLCYRFEYSGRVDKCAVVTIDNNTGEVVLLSVDAEREREWAQGMKRGRFTDVRSLEL